MQPTRRQPGHFFLVGVLLGSACGLLLGSALGLQVRPERVRALRRLVRRLLGGDEDRVHFEYLV